EPERTGENRREPERTGENRREPERTVFRLSLLRYIRPKDVYTLKVNKSSRDPQDWANSNRLLSMHKINPKDLFYA
ncbi:hypothetical protein, partial [Pseudomonas lactucae]|uniref:hypothetical protein n=1 Tax=Pseudomonas lactucae TaxID=2813360 RepID=UPI002FCCDA08